MLQKCFPFRTRRWYYFDFIVLLKIYHIRSSKYNLLSTTILVILLNPAKYKFSIQGNYLLSSFMSSQYYCPRTGKPDREYRAVIDLFWKQTVVESNASNNSEINFVPDIVHCLDSVWTMDRPANNLDHCTPTAIENQESLCFSLSLPPPPVNKVMKIHRRS